MKAQKRGQDWTAILARANIETPGYREAVEKTLAITAEKKMIAALHLEKKTNKRKRK